MRWVLGVLYSIGLCMTDVLASRVWCSHTHISFLSHLSHSHSAIRRSTCKRTAHIQMAISWLADVFLSIKKALSSGIYSRRFWCVVCRKKCFELPSITIVDEYFKRKLLLVLLWMVKLSVEHFSRIYAATFLLCVFTDDVRKAMIVETWVEDFIEALLCSLWEKYLKMSLRMWGMFVC